MTTPDLNTFTLARSAALDNLINAAEFVSTRTDTLDMIRAAIMVELHATNARRAIISQARAEGRTWQEIGDALGVTRQSAHERFGQ
ncbi:hypothetical protein D6T64_12190 [Cryobacterium melibiosiphilum]|uniref:Uncharacterized protein n=1 Tax=Cryobacterium melibiosiphilum TaxID=995039 RepID=A0A3A5MLZ2_9MICO|nr:hypothetical protein [Cryobacterium melibiosiphilum]RJT88138.1 hypothetical protein D6T64_12190 [Cryobacterium melibiosiphilum]